MVLRLAVTASKGHAAGGQTRTKPVVMLLQLLPWGLIVTLLIPTQEAFASTAVNVALQASFHSPPYLLELLLVTIKLRQISREES